MKKEEQYWSPKVKEGNVEIPFNQNDNQESQKKLMDEKLNKTYLSLIIKDNEISRLKKKVKSMEAHLKQLENKVPKVPESSLTHSKGCSCSISAVRVNHLIISHVLIINNFIESYFWKLVLNAFEYLILM